jgi:hypothetical protein
MDMIIDTRKLQLLLLACTLLIPFASGAQSKRSAADQRLYEKARKACSGPEYPNGARIVINYKGGWFRCDDYRRRGSRS